MRADGGGEEREEGARATPRAYSGRNRGRASEICIDLQPERYSKVPDPLRRIYERAIGASYFLIWG